MPKEKKAYIQQIAGRGLKNLGPTHKSVEADDEKKKGTPEKSGAHYPEKGA